MTRACGERPPGPGRVGGRAGRARARASRSTSPGATTPRCGPTTARSSRCRRPTRPAWASGWCSRTGTGEGNRRRVRLGRLARAVGGRRRRWPRPGTTPRFATPDPDVRPGRARRGRRRPSSTCGTTASPPTPTEQEGGAGRSTSSARSAAPTPGSARCDSADYGDGRVEVALASTTGIRAVTPADLGLPLGRRPSPARAPTPRPAAGFSVGRGPADLDPDRAAADAVHRAVRMLGATKARSARCTVVFDPRVVSTLLSVVSSALSGEAVVKGRSFFAGRIGEAVAAPTRHPGRRPDRPPGVRRRHLRRRGAGLPAQRADRGRRAAGFVYDTVSARRAGTASTGSAVRGGFAGTPGAGCRAAGAPAGRSDRPRRSWPRWARASTSSRSPASTPG